MSAYRVYCLDGASRFITAEWIEADDDGHALAVAAQLTHGLTREVWDRDRLVGRIEVDPGDGPGRDNLV
jgi:hypothetical protein